MAAQSAPSPRPSCMSISSTSHPRRRGTMRSPMRGQPALPGLISGRRVKDRSATEPACRPCSGLSSLSAGPCPVFMKRRTWIGCGRAISSSNGLSGSRRTRESWCFTERSRILKGVPRRPRRGRSRAVLAIRRLRLCHASSRRLLRAQDPFGKLVLSAKGRVRIDETGIFKTDRAPPDDETVERWIDEYRMEKYG
jgi:hypothetical protein